MKKMHLSRLLTFMFGVLLLTSCQLDPLNDNLKKEEYTRAFIKEFGLIDPNQDWNLATSVNVSVALGDTPARSVKVYGKYQDTYYLVANLSGASGTVEVPVDLPKATTDMLAVVDGHCYFGRVGAPIDCTGIPARVSRADASTFTVLETPQLYDPETWTHNLSKSRDNSTQHTVQYGDYSVSVSDAIGQYMSTTSKYSYDASYQVFNAQQIAPILCKSNETWADYYSLNSGKMYYNTSGKSGLMPEGTGGNQTIGNTNNTSVIQDSRYKITDGKLTVYPMYYGTNLIQILGVYLIDDNDNAILANDGNPLKFPIYKTKQNDDIILTREITNTGGGSGYVSITWTYGGNTYTGSMQDSGAPVIEMRVGQKMYLDIKCYDTAGNLVPMADCINDITLETYNQTFSYT